MYVHVQAKIDFREYQTFELFAVDVCCEGVGGRPGQPLTQHSCKTRLADSLRAAHQDAAVMQAAQGGRTRGETVLRVLQTQLHQHIHSSADDTRLSNIDVYHLKKKSAIIISVTPDCNRTGYQRSTVPRRDTADT